MYLEAKTLKEYNMFYIIYVSMIQKLFPSLFLIWSPYVFSRRKLGRHDFYELCIWYHKDTKCVLNMWGQTCAVLYDHVL